MRAHERLRIRKEVSPFETNFLCIFVGMGGTGGVDEEDGNRVWNLQRWEAASESFRLIGDPAPTTLLAQRGHVAPTSLAPHAVPIPCQWDGTAGISRWRALPPDWNAIQGPIEEHEQVNALAEAPSRMI